MELSVGKLAEMFGISRTALLYYETIGLLKPSARSKAGYRLYSDADGARLGQIMLFRKAGVSLEDISALIDANDTSIASLLFKRLGELNSAIEAIKMQQDMIVRIIRSTRLHADRRKIGMEKWTMILKDAGINEANADKWHRDFEEHSPGQHRKFLELLGFGSDEISNIRKRYRGEP